MGYYTAAGDYARRGGYYRGDGFWSTIGGGIKSLAGFVKSPLGSMVTGLVPGGGLIHAAAQSVDTHASTSGAGSGAAAAQLPSAPTEGGMFASHAPSSMPGKGPVSGHPAALATIAAHGPHTHISRRTGQLVKGRRPRMNPLNVKALRRGIRRAHAFARIARSVVTFAKHGVHGTKFKGHFGPKRKRLHA